MTPETKPIEHELLTIRRVVNGWILNFASGHPYEGQENNTLVFNDIEDLCTTLKDIYTIGA